MTLPSAAGLTAALLLSAAAAQDAASKPAAKTGVSLGAANVEAFGKLAHSYFGHVDAPNESKKAESDLKKLRDESAKVAKALKVSDSLVALDDWRDLVRRALVSDKPAVTVTWHQELKLVDLASPIAPVSDDKQFKEICDGRLKLLVSVPTDFTKVAYPVLLVLHPIDDETDKGLKDLRKSKAITDSVKTWSAGVFSKELLAKAIVVVPIMDAVVNGSKPLTFSRPHWDDPRDNFVGAQWAFKPLLEVVLNGMNYDPRRIFIDGHGTSASAALRLCTRYPGLVTGAIARGAPDPDLDLAGCNGSPILALAPEPKADAAGSDSNGDKQAKQTKDFWTRWSKIEGVQVTQKESVEDAALVQWLADHPKNYAPQRIRISSKDIAFDSAYWLKVSYIDTSLEKVDHFFIEAVVDREKNTISVVTNPKVKEFLVFLNDDILNLDKEIVVLHRREGEEKDVEKFRGTKVRLLGDMLKDAYKSPYSNTGEIYVAQIKIQL